jgi:hypothetical protein
MRVEIQPVKPLPPQAFYFFNHTQTTQGTHNTWHFTCVDRMGFSIHLSRFKGTFDLCHRTQLGEMCWETRTLSSHQTVELV